MFVRKLISRRASFRKRTKPLSMIWQKKGNSANLPLPQKRATRIFDNPPRNMRKMQIYSNSASESEYTDDDEEWKSEERVDSDSESDAQTSINSDEADSKEKSDVEIVDGEDVGHEKMKVSKQKRKRPVKIHISATENATETVDRTIFVGNLNANISENLIKSHFAKYGRIEDIRLKTIAISNRPLQQLPAAASAANKTGDGFAIAYIRFENVNAARTAIIEESGKVLAKQHMRVTPARADQIKIDDSRTLMVGNLAYRAAEEDLYAAFAACGPIEMVRILRDKRTNLSKGSAYVVFKRKDSVQLALDMGEVDIRGRILRLQPSEFGKYAVNAHPRRIQDECIYVANLGPHVTESVLKEAFGSFGEIDMVSIARARKNHMPLGYAFVTFKSAEAASAALLAEITINGRKVDIYQAKCSIEAERKQQTRGSEPRKMRLAQSPQASVTDGRATKHKKKSKAFQGTRSAASPIAKKKPNKNRMKNKKIARILASGKQPAQ